MSPTSVLFLAPTIRAGSGGVADYCLRLSDALSAQGIVCHLASWNECDRDGNEESDPRERRLFLENAAGAGPRAKTKRLQSYLVAHQVEWVSLQFVNFGFARRGLIQQLGGVLAEAFHGRRLHVFLHELWAGAHRGAPWRERILGGMQKRQLLRLLSTLQPEAVWTSIELYRWQMERAGISADVVPIFGSIPLSRERADEWLLRQLPGNPPASQRGEYLFVGLFGSLVKEWPFREVLPHILRLAQHRRVVFILFGRNGDLTAFGDYVDSLPGAELLVLGELGETVIDQVMNSMDLALATAPAEGIFKSTSALAFLERGVPTVALPRGLGPRSVSVISPHPSLLLLNDELEKNLDALGATRSPQPLLPTVAQRYLNLLVGPPADGNERAPASDTVTTKL